MRYASTLLFAALLIALPACDSGSDDDGGGEDAVSIEGGLWESERASINDEDVVVVRLDFDTDGSDVSGSGEFDFVEGEGGQVIDLSLDGDYDAPQLDVTASQSGGGEEIGFDCTVESESSMECRMEVVGGETFASGVDFSR
jgi:hypothetical protein